MKNQAYKFKSESEKQLIIDFCKSNEINICDEIVDFNHATGLRINISNHVRCIKSCDCKSLLYIDSLIDFLTILKSEL